jgi:hypothetical protein
MRSSMLAHRNHCPRCPVIGAEHRFGDVCYTLFTLRFSLRIAEELAYGHDPIKVDSQGLSGWLRHADIDLEHLDHLPRNTGPGIMITLPNGSGQPIIDGNHRAARCLRDGRDFMVFILTEPETLELLRRTMGVVTADDLWKRLCNSKPHPDDKQGEQFR